VSGTGQVDHPAGDVGRVHSDKRAISTTRPWGRSSSGTIRRTGSRKRRSEARRGQQDFPVGQSRYLRQKGVDDLVAFDQADPRP